MLLMDESRIDDIPHVTPEEKNFLIASFFQEEISKVVFHMGYNKPPSPDGFPAKFYQHF